MQAQLDRRAAAPAAASASSKGAPRRHRRPLEGRGRDLIERPALVDRLLAPATPIALVQAPAGSGKTVLLAQAWRRLEAQGEGVLWLSLTPSDARCERLLSHLQAVFDEAGLALAGASAGPHGPADQGGELADRLAAADRPVTLFIDNLQLLEGSPALALVQGLVLGVSDRLRLVLATRTALSLPLARLRAQAQLQVLTGVDLAFTVPEAASLLARHGGDWPEAWCTELHRRSEGWAAGLCLLGQCLAEAPQQLGADRLAQCTGELPALADYFDQEVVGPLAREDAALEPFLLQVSVLEQLSPALCEAVTLRHDGQALLEQVVARGALVAAADPQAHWYRMNTLFAQYLRRRLRESAPAQRRLLHQRASTWMQGERRYVEAFDHAMLAGEPERAARIFDTEILDSWCAGTFGSPRVDLLTMCGRIPPQIKHRYPRIMLLEAWRRDVLWQFEGSKELLDITRRQLARIESEGAESPESVESLRGLLRHGEMMLSLVGDEPLQAEVQCEHLLRDYPQANPYVKASFYSSLLTAQREQYKLSGAERLAALAREYCVRAGEGPIAVFSEASILPVFMMMGRTETALRSLHAALAVAERLGGGGGALGSIVALLAADMHYERNELDQAQALIDQYLPHGTVCGFVDQLIAGWGVAARLHRHQGQAEAAEAVLHEAISFARMHGFERLRVNAAGELVRLLLGQGRFEEVDRLAREHQIDGEARTLLPGKGTTTRDEARALAWTRIALSHNQLAEAHAVAKHWRNFLEAAGAVRPLLRWELVMVHHALLSGDTRAAQRLLRRAIALAVPGRLVRSFLDEGTWLEGLLRKQGETQSHGGDLRCDAFAAELLAAFDAQHGRRKTTAMAVDSESLGGIYGALSPREVEILSLVAGGLLNREIGEKLGMTEGSVKWYLQRIYDKLGVRRRSQAMDRAVKMGIIAG
jgi:LuxR family maltose regulon positive regulatory protein